jgi:hypothetical protein
LEPEEEPAVEVLPGEEEDEDILIIKKQLFVSPSEKQQKYLIDIYCT